MTDACINVLNSSLQFCSVTVYGTSGQSIHNFREVATEWMQKHPHSAILVTLIAHSTVTTGEIVYANPGAQQNRYASVDQVRRQSRFSVI